LISNKRCKRALSPSQPKLTRPNQKESKHDF
jgi:hypothetical protein